MKFHTSLRTKCYLIMAPLVALFLLLTLALVHATWHLRSEVAEVEHSAQDALWSGRLSRAMDRYQADYWGLVATHSRSEAEQLGRDAEEVQRMLEHLLRQSADDQAQLAELQVFAKDFVLVRRRVAEASQLLTDPAGSEQRPVEQETGRVLREVVTSAKTFAETSGLEVVRATGDVVATTQAVFGRNSGLCRAAQAVAPEAQEIALVQRVMLGFGAELIALAQYTAHREAASSAERLVGIRNLHADVEAALAELEENEKAATDQEGKQQVDTIRQRYALVSTLGQRLIQLSANTTREQRYQLEIQFQEAVQSLHSGIDDLAGEQADDLLRLTQKLLSALHRTEGLIAALSGFFLLIAGGVPYLLMRKIMVPVLTLTGAIYRFKNGDLETKVPATSKDEMGELAAGFNSMTHALSENIEERQRAEEMARDQEEQIRLLLESTAEAIYGLDLQGRCTFCNRSCVRLLGYQHAEQLLGRSMHELIHYSRADGTPVPLQQCRNYVALKSGRGCHSDDDVLWRADGSCFPAESWSHLQVKGGKAVGAVVTFIDITQRKEAEAKIESLAYFDALTGLPNRVLLQDRLAKALARARRYHEKVAVLFLDLDGFKVINDSLGHSVGDVLLKQVAERLQECAREQDTVARLGGDEFVVVLTSVKEVADVAVAAERIRSALLAEFVVLEHALHVSCSLGISLFPEHANDGDDLVKYADAAMYRAKDTGRNHVQFFTEGLNAEVMERLVLENSLRQAQERNELFLMYQPQVDMVAGTLVGTEALIRWQHPELGLVPPDKFIPIAENSGLIIPIGEWVLRTACRDAKRWQQDGLPEVPVSVNVSAVQFRQAGFAELVGTILGESGLDPQWLELEITESLILSNADVTVAVFRKLNEMGVKLAIDDFGTGYSSLGYLKHFPIHKLKIDQSFVRDLAVDPDDAAITGTIISMARNLGLKVIAEGVEQQQQVAFLRSHECDEAQGYFFSRPVRVDDLAATREKLRKQEAGMFVAD